MIIWSLGSGYFCGWNSLTLSPWLEGPIGIEMVVLQDYNRLVLKNRSNELEYSAVYDKECRAMNCLGLVVGYCSFSLKIYSSQFILRTFKSTSIQ